MIIKIEELCLVDYIKEGNYKDGDSTIAIRTVFYETDASTLLEAFTSYEKEFDSDKIISCEGDFDGSCLETIDVMSVKVVKGDD